MEVMDYLASDGDFEILFIGKFALKQLHTLEKLIDGECARVLALRQPAASDLRMIISVTIMSAC